MAGSNTVTIHVELDDAGVKSGVRSITSTLDGVKTDSVDNLGKSTKAAGDSAGESSGKYTAMANTMANVGTSMTMAGNTMTDRVTRPLVDMGKTAVETAGEFNQTMNMVQAMSGASAQEIEKLRQKAIQVGGDTKFSANESAAALLELSKAGISNDDIINGVLDSTMKLATVGEMGLAESATVATNAMNTFGLSAQDTDSIVVALAGAANASTADVSSLAQGLGNCGAVANSVGWSINDVCGALALFEDNGIHGAEAGTQLKSMLMKLIDPSDQAAATMKQYGIEVYDSNGKMKSFGEIAEQLQTKLSGLSDEERNAALANIFGTYAVQGATIAFNNGKDTIDKYTKATYDANAANDMMNAAMSDIPGALERMSGSIETMLMAIGNALAPVVIAVADFIGMLADAFTSLPAPVQTVIAAILAVIAAIGPLLLIGGTVLSMISTIMLAAQGGALAIVGSALATVGPILGIVAAVAAVVAALVWFFTQTELGREIWNGFVEFITGLWNGIVTTAQTVWTAVSTAATQAWETICNAVQVALMFIGELINAAVQIITLPWQFLWQNFGGILTSAWEGITGFLGPKIDWVRQQIEGAWNFVTDKTSKAWDAATTTVKGAWDLITGNTSKESEAVKGAITAAWNAADNITGGKFSEIANTVRDKMQAAQNAVSGAVSAIQNGVSNGFNAARNTAESVFNAIQDAVRSKIDAAASFVGGAIDRIKGFFNFSWSLPHLALPHPWISGSFSLNPPSVPSFGISWYAAGGKFDSPSIIGIGEGRYDEVALPLSPKVLRGIGAGITGQMAPAADGEGGITVTVYIEHFENHDSKTDTRKLTGLISDQVEREIKQRRGK